MIDVQVFNNRSIIKVSVYNKNICKNANGNRNTKISNGNKNN